MVSASSGLVRPLQHTQGQWSKGHICSLQTLKHHTISVYMCFPCHNCMHATSWSCACCHVLASCLRGRPLPAQLMTFPSFVRVCQSFHFSVGCHLCAQSIPSSGANTPTTFSLSSVCSKAASSKPCSSWLHVSNISIIGRRPKTCIMLVLFKSAHYSDSPLCTQFMLMNGIGQVCRLPPARSRAQR